MQNETRHKSRTRFSLRELLMAIVVISMAMVVATVRVWRVASRHGLACVDRIHRGADCRHC
jgi:hypothetical protein